MNHQREIKRIVKSLIPYKPERIYLFGSFAYGRPKRDSDIDLLVIKKTKNLIIREFLRQDCIFPK
jgi:predicted nucleotidyltransferase